MCSWFLIQIEDWEHFYWYRAPHKVQLFELLSSRCFESGCLIQVRYKFHDISENCL
jgi:hypothetical protein